MKCHVGCHLTCLFRESIAIYIKAGLLARPNR